MSIIVNALPWHINAPRDGTWWIGLEGQEESLDGGTAHWVIASNPTNRHSGTSHADAVAALEKHIAEAQLALIALKSGEPYGEFSE